MKRKTVQHMQRVSICGVTIIDGKLLVAVEESFTGKSYDHRLEECLPQPRIQLFGHFVEQESTTMTREKQTSHSVFSEIELVFQMEEKHTGVICCAERCIW